MKTKCSFFRHVILLFLGFWVAFSLYAQKQEAVSLEKNLERLLPSEKLLDRPFGRKDFEMFEHPDKVFYPEIWIDCLCGNLSKKGILADLEAISEAGFAGVQMFFGNRGDAWPGVEQIACLSPQWEEFVQYAAQESQRLGLRFTLQNCPGWAMAGGPWIKPEKAMRHIVWSSVHSLSEERQATSAHIQGGEIRLSLPKAPQADDYEWRDYQDIAVLAFPTPLGDTEGEIVPSSVEPAFPQGMTPTDDAHPHVFTIQLPEVRTVRSVEFSSVQRGNHQYSYDVDIQGKLEAVYPDGSTQILFDSKWPQSCWQDEMPFTLACRETAPAKEFRLSISNRRAFYTLFSLRLFSLAKKNSWENEAGWCLRSILHEGDLGQPKEAYISEVKDLTDDLQPDGILRTTLPSGDWTILRIGHVNTGKKNAPAPPEATGFECNKFDTEAIDTHFDGYIGRLAKGSLSGLLDGMLLDSWECETQTWTATMEEEFRRINGYELRPWIPALMGYVVQDPETTSRFLRDWRATLNDLIVNKFYKRISERGHETGLTVTYETAGGDVFPSDIMEYYKWADIPMCEFWLHPSDDFLGSLNFKPIKPTASAGRLYGKRRVAAEAFTSWSTTWDEQFSNLWEIANVNNTEGASYLIFQAYTHNPRPDELVPGTSFGDGICTPFLRAQTWWKHMHSFTDCAARTSFLLERGKPVSDVLWYLGDELDHKPDQYAPFPEGYKYDYCNPDVLLHRLKVENGLLCTPEGLSYRLLYLPQTRRMLPETLEKIVQLVDEGAIVVGGRPEGLATLSGGAASQECWNKAVKTLWDEGKVCTLPLEEALEKYHLHPDLQGGPVLWQHRKTEGADWYYVCAPKGGSFEGTLSLRAQGSVERWSPITGERLSLDSQVQGDRTEVHVSLQQAESCFLVVQHNSRNRKSEQIEQTGSIAIEGPWTFSIPSGWGLDHPIQLPSLSWIKDLNIPAEAKAFSGTSTYGTRFSLEKKESHTRYVLNLGEVGQIARIVLNGKPLPCLWIAPYEQDISSLLWKGENELTIEITNTWFNRLSYEAALPETERKTWTTRYPSPEEPLRKSGLKGPVKIDIRKQEK